MAAGAGLAAAPRAFAQQTKQGRWLRFETPNFIVYSAGDEEKTRAEIGALEGFHALLSKLIPPRQTGAIKLPIYLTGNDRDFSETAPWAERGVLGFWQSSVEGMRAVSTLHKNMERQRNMPKNVRAMDSRTVLLHEYAHHYIIANMRVTYPAWYNEGIAEFLSTADFVEDGVLVGKFTSLRAQWLMGSGLLNINTFLTASPGDLSIDKQGQFYAQAWLAAHYLFQNKDRAAGFDKYITALHEGADPLAAFEPAFGILPQTFDRELNNYKTKPMQFGKVAGVTAALPADMKVERLPVSADDLLMAVSHLRNVPVLKQSGKAVSIVRAQHKKYEADPFAIRSRALAEIWYGDLGEARKLLDKLLPTEADNAETQHLSGLCDLRAAYASKDKAMFARARKGFSAAHRIDGSRASSLFRYVECGVREQDGKIDDHNADVLFMAYQMAPQVEEYAQVLALALIQRKRFREALNVLRPQIGDSHDSDKEAAMKLVAAAKAEKDAEFFWPESAESIRTDDDD
jgi:hypothetical protein